MRFTEIETFRALMRAGSTRKAAALLHVTQPAISQSLKRLETQAGLRLFQRTGARLVPTPEAHALWSEVERVFIGMDAIEHRMRSLRDFGTNQLEISCYPAFGLGFMPRALERLKTQRGDDPWPQVSLQVLSSKDVRDRVAKGLSDFGLMADELPLDGIAHSTFARFPGVVVMPQGHALARFKRIELEQLAQVPFLALNPEDPSHRWLEAALAERGVVLRAAVQTPYAASVCEMALRGLGVGLVNPVTALDYADRGLVVRRLAADVFFSCVLAMPAGKVLSATARDFLSLMRRQLAEDEKRIQRCLR
ncbi:DNA-binding transcriptional LysR family regulator [Variovorax sp. TBS-050B]|uniref:LysR substrate-binding domain-containing protein n=1 Tax=Variovorax sp. TBS-050B TaxID=2940551 RepID=UPI0024757C46|nr:LysR substrate-binding domain-containing protein [Variovorax sp. TBS-050B]MDH6591175.1 DNA-binding transcriptional LysR family regulator [Variovorax sp. TBS-050B]